MAEEDAKTEVKGSPADQNPNSVEATIETSVGCGETESTCNNNNGNNAESSAGTDGGKRENSLEYADELIARGSKAAKEGDYVEATDCYSRALEIRVVHFGELAPECVTAYYKYGCALLRKAQEEADPLGSMPKKESASQEDTVDGKDEEGEDESDAEELADGDEDESDLDLAWKMLDVARAIVEKLSGDSMEKVDILSSLAEVALEREDVETSLSDYSKALSMLERLVEPDSRLIAELLEDLQQLVSNPKHALADILGIMMSAKAKATEESALSVGMSSSRMGTCVTAGSTTSEVVSTAGTNGASGVTHLGVVGRGVKRVVMSSTEQPVPKKPSIDPSSNNGDDSTS
ncbi:hypothetical protein OROHE_026238 [Orobanche hederae]